MRERIFKEYQKAFDCLETNQCDAKKMKPIFDAMEIILTSSNVSRKEGLLALEEYIMKLDKKDALLRYYSELVMLVVDGTDPELVEEISLYKLISFGLQGVEKVAGIMYLLGGLAIQGGENPRVIAEKMYALMPLQWRCFHESEKELNEKENKSSEETLEEILATIEEKESPFIPEKDGYFLVRLNELMINKLDDASIQRLLRDTDSADLEVAMKGMGGKAVSKILRNLSDRLAIMIVEDMRFMGPVRMKDVARSNQTILRLAIKLMQSEEIVSLQYEFLKSFIPNIEMDINESNKQLSSYEFRKLLDEYDTVVFGTVE